MIGAPTAAVIALAMPLLHLGAVAIAPLVAVVHLVVVRWALVADALRVLGPTRRRFNRWLARFAFLWVGVPGYAAMVTPVAGAVVGVGTFAGLTALVHHYALWSLKRELERRPLLGWEKGLLAVLAVATLVVLTLLAALAVLLGWSAAALLGALTSGPS